MVYRCHSISHSLSTSKTIMGEDSQHGGQICLEVLVNLEQSKEIVRSHSFIANRAKAFQIRLSQDWRPFTGDSDPLDHSLRLYGGFNLKRCATCPSHRKIKTGGDPWKSIFPVGGVFSPKMCSLVPASFACRRVPNVW